MSLVSQPSDYSSDNHSEPYPQLLNPPIQSLDEQDTLLAKRPHPEAPTDGSLPHKRQRIHPSAWARKNTFGRRQRRTFSDDDDSDKESSSHPLSSPIGSPLSPFVSKPKLGRRVKWHDEEDIESVKYFKLTDLPSAQGLSFDEVVEVQEAVRNIPPSRKLEEVIKLDQAIQRRKEEESLKSKDQNQLLLDEMTPVVAYRWNGLFKCSSSYSPLVLNEKDLAQAAKERHTQAQRERNSYSYQPLQLRPPMNPLQEFSTYRPRDGDCPVQDLKDLTEFNEKRRHLDGFVSILKKENESVSRSTDFSGEQKEQISKKIVGIRTNHVEVSDDRIAAASLISLQHMTETQLSTLRQEIGRIRQANHKQELDRKNGENQIIKYSNFRTVPCKNFHGPQGCIRGDTCHFIHAPDFERQQLPREVFHQYRNENQRKNMLEAIREVNADKAEEFERLNANNVALSQFINAHNNRIQGRPPPQSHFQPQYYNQPQQYCPNPQQQQPLQHQPQHPQQPLAQQPPHPQAGFHGPPPPNGQQLGQCYPPAQSEPIRAEALKQQLQIQQNIEQLKHQMSTPGLQPQHLAIIQSRIHHLILALQFLEAQHQGNKQQIALLQPLVAQSQLKQKALAQQLSNQLQKAEDEGVWNMSNGGSSSTNCSNRP